jgi:hypothetical protein
MAKSIEEKLAAIKVINEQKDKVDSVQQRMDLNPDTALLLTVDNIPIADLLSPLMQGQIKQLVKTSLQNKRNELVHQATQLMK